MRSTSGSGKSWRGPWAIGWTILACLLPAAAGAETPGACVERAAAEVCGGAGAAVLKRTVDARTTADARVATLEGRLSALAEKRDRDIQLERDLATTRIRGLEVENRSLSERLAAAPPVRLALVLVGAGVAVAAGGVGCLVADGCPAGLGWAGVGGGVVGAAVGFGVGW